MVCVQCKREVCVQCKQEINKCGIYWYSKKEQSTKYMTYNDVNKHVITQEMARFYVIVLQAICKHFFVGLHYHLTNIL